MRTGQAATHKIIYLTPADVRKAIKAYVYKHHPLDYFDLSKVVMECETKASITLRKDRPNG